MSGCDAWSSLYASVETKFSDGRCWQAASIFEDFVASFDAGDDRQKDFVRGGAAGDRYRMDASSRGAAVALGRGGFSDGPPAAAAGNRAGKKMSEMERMLEEMKEREEAKLRPAPTVAPRPAVPAVRGSFDDGGGDSTNLYVGNVAPTVTEEGLKEKFERFGEIYSVKIMWPRTDEERARRRNCGFVSFMTRGDAADALHAMNGAEVEGYIMSVGWGKAIKHLSNNPSMLGQAGGFLKVKGSARRQLQRHPKSTPTDGPTVPADC